MSNQPEKRPPPFKEIRLGPYVIWHIAEGPEGEECFVDQIIANEKAGRPSNYGIPYSRPIRPGDASPPSESEKREQDSE